MIKYSLICGGSHEFEAWFSGSADFDVQAKDGLLMCPMCGTSKVEKAIMAPNISTSRTKDALVKKQAKAAKMMSAAAETIRREIETQCDNVGDKFAEEARAIHYGEKPERGIYGQASAREASELIDEGVKVAPLPDILTPKSKTDLN
ncbi:MAG: DUF1178 family protein [Alphaproteobacteria bacterium]